MTIEPDPDVREPKKRSYGAWRKSRIKRKKQYQRKLALENKQSITGTLTDEERGRLKELQDEFD